VIGEILARGRTSRFYRRLVGGKQVAQEVSADQYPGSGLLGSADPGLFLVRGAPRAPHTAEELEGAVLEEVAALGREPVSAEELERVKTNLEADFIRGLRSNLGLGAALADHEGLGGDWRGLLRAPERVRAVTDADVMRVARQYLVASNRTVGWLVRPAGGEGP
jgi:predicted Zn-dependent peptidase